MTFFSDMVRGLKGVRINALPEAAWDNGGGGQPHDAATIYRHYKSVPWLYQGVNIRANAASSVPYQLNSKRTGEQIEKPEALPGLRTWWAKLPNIIDGMEADRALYGAAYVFKERNAVVIINLRRLDPSTMKPIFDESGNLSYFERRIKGQSKRIDLEDVVYSWIPSRKEENKPGASPAGASLEAAGMLRNIDRFASGYFDRGAINTLLIDVEEGGNSEADRERLNEWIMRKVRGVKNAFNVNVGRRKLNVHELGSNTGDLALPELTNAKREDVATALGVPQSLLFSSAANFATAQADTLNFHDKTVLPEIDKIKTDLNMQLFNEIGPGYALVFQPEKLEVFQAVELQKAGVVTQVYEAGIISLDEARQVLDYDPVPVTEEVAEAVAAAKVAEIFGYHIELGVVDRNEARAVMGLEPREEGDEKQLQDMQRRLTLVSAATSAGLPLKRALEMAGLSAEGIEDEIKALPVKSEMAVDLEKWQRKAVKRIAEGKPNKAREFESEHISSSLRGAIMGAIEGVANATEIPGIFENALTWEGYP